MNPQIQQSSANTSTPPNLPPRPKSHTNLLLAILLIIIGIILIIALPFIALIGVMVFIYDGPRPVPLAINLIRFLPTILFFFCLYASFLCFMFAGKFLTKHKALSKPPQNPKN